MNRGMMILALVTAALLSSHPADAVALSVADCGTLQEADRPFQRYVWCPTWLGEQSPWAVSYATNLAVSRSDVIQLPAIAANEQAGWLVRWDLRRLARGDADHLAELHALWERLGAAEPYFSIRKSVKVDEGGRKVTRIVAAPAAHTGLEQATLLRGLTKSSVPMVRAESRNRDAASIDKLGCCMMDFRHATTSESSAGRVGVPRPDN